MRKIDVSQIVDPNIQQPFTGLSLDFLQTGTKQMVFALCWNIIKSKGFTYSATVPYYIAATADAGFTSDGVVFYGGELYLMTENFAGLQYAVIDTTPDATADPLLFTDNISRNVHNNRYLSYSASATGALFDVNNIVNAMVSFMPAITVGSGGSAPSFQNSWAASTAVKFRKNIDGLLSLEGVATKATTSGGTIFTLPVGYRPSVQKYISCYLVQAGAIVTEFLIVDTNGDVSINFAPSATNTDLYLNGINFYLS
jgi:hypothetical protein